MHPHPVATAAPPVPAETPPPAVGQTEMQPSPPTSTAPSPPSEPKGTSTEEPPSPSMPPPAPDAIVGVRPDGTPVTAVQAAQPGSDLPTPNGSSVITSVAVEEVRAFPEATSSESLAVPGVSRTYQTPQTYADTVRFFDRSGSAGTFVVSSRESTPNATLWSVRAQDGRRAFIAVRDTRPTTFEIVETRP